jgi:hypothetical protein
MPPEPRTSAPKSRRGSRSYDRKRQS